MTIGVILMTYGAPTGDEDIAAYLGRVRGREPTPELAVEMRRRYRLIGGSPLVDITRAQAEALADVLGTDFRVRAGMRFSEPAIESEVDALVAEGAKAGLEQWSSAYQSAGHTAEEWLRPDLVDLFPSLAAQGATDVLVVPVQFLADHLEVLYDLDIAAAAQAREAGLRYHRIAMPNTRPDFICALAAIVRAL